MCRLSGPLLMATGVLDLLYVLVFHSRQLAAVARDGFFGAIEVNPAQFDREVAFWHLAFGVTVLILGGLVHWAQARTGTLPTFLGWSLLAFGLFGATLVPVSGFWAVLPQAVLMLVVARRGANEAMGGPIRSGEKPGTVSARSFDGKEEQYEKQRVAELQRAQRQESVEGFMEGDQRMRLANTAHTLRPWRIHEIASDFELEDVWALPTPGGPDDFPRLVRQIASLDPSGNWPGAARTLWELRDKIGKLLGWDDPDAGLGSRVSTLRDRLPADLRDVPSGPEFDALPATSLYLTDDEFAAEGANRTVHGIMHLGWVPDGAGGYRGQMAVYVKPNGLFGTAYMAAIKPFRYLIVYPALMRLIGREWRELTHESR